ncbi:CpaD family pilus assembly protein [Novosphingopyxis sp.]|uniref:CpaD family pilus assembly protein n=1 Tax=Novosphingopyxis sp. TaxID=2709690 RepID=UPI003B595F4F
MHIMPKLTIAALGLSLAACSGNHINRTVYSVHQPVVTRANYAIDLNAGGGLAPAERQRLGEWMTSLGAGYGDRVAIDYGSGYGDASTEAAVADVAADFDVQVAQTAPVTAGAVVPGTVRVVLTRSTASVPSCPDWSKKSEANYDGGNHSNYGCATNSNLAAMIADPEDLVRGQDDHGHDSSRAVRPVEAWRNGNAGSSGGN